MPYSDRSEHVTGIDSGTAASGFINLGPPMGVPVKVEALTVANRTSSTNAFFILFGTTGSSTFILDPDDTLTVGGWESNGAAPIQVFVLGGNLTATLAYYNG